MITPNRRLGWKDYPENLRAATPSFFGTRKFRLSSLLGDEALDGAAEITARVRKPRHGEARAVGTDPGFPIQQDPRADRLPREMDAEAGINEGPLPKSSVAAVALQKSAATTARIGMPVTKGLLGKLRLLRGYLIGSGEVRSVDP
jgi:hypothetical protein